MLGIRIPLGLLAALLAFAVSTSGVASATIIEVGDLNVIDDAGNPSDGLRFLDSAFSAGLTLAAALANAQLTYPGAHLATPSEFDDLFAAAGIVYNGTLTASDGFETGPQVVIVDTGSTAVMDLIPILGTTDAFGFASFWTLPDGSSNVATTRDLVQIRPEGRVILTHASSPPHPGRGWLLVVPEPTTFSLLALGTLALGLRRRRAAVR